MCDREHVISVYMIRLHERLCWLLNNWITLLWRCAVEHYNFAGYCGDDLRFLPHLECSSKKYFAKVIRKKTEWAVFYDSYCKCDIRCLYIIVDCNGPIVATRSPTRPFHKQTAVALQTGTSDGVKAFILRQRHLPRHRCQDMRRAKTLRISSSSSGGCRGRSRCHELSPCRSVLCTSFGWRQAKVHWSQVGLHRSEPGLSGSTVGPPSPLHRRAHDASLEGAVMIRPRVGAVEVTTERETASTDSVWQEWLPS